jgi:CheY-like chemotaxis protein/HPt (histidine-containing phosphotransfer) domain-containing protein
MDAEQLEKVFQSFTQADGTLTRRHGGVGLGLSISQALARLMGGSLWAESSPGKGSVFHAVLPFAPGADASRPAVAPAKGRTERGRDMSELWTDAGGTGAKPRILLVEDNEINQEIAGELLRDLNVDVAFAEDGERAVAAVRAGRFDMIFMDIQMPVMDGLEATRQIRASGIDWACAVPIIAMTAHGMNEDRERSLAAGMSDHLTKPIDPEELRRAIARWLPENPVGAAVPAAEAESPVTRRLQGLYGVDVKSGLANVAGNEKLYLSLLNRFTVKYRGSPGELPALLKANDREGALRLVHTIKGVAANLGAHRLADLVKRIESAMLAKESVTSLLVPYARELARVAQGIERLSRELTAQEGGGVGEAVSPDHVPHILGALGTLPELLQTDWGQAQEKVESLGGLLAHTDAADIYSRLADALEEFDVPAFMAACQELIRHLRRA